MTLFDASAWVGAWPFTGSAITLAGLSRELRGAGFGGAAVSPLDAVLAPEPTTAGMALAADVLAHEDDVQLRLVPVINPALHGWERDMDTLLSACNGGIGAVKIVPNYHGYAIDGALSIALARRAAALDIGVCVQVRMLDERAHHPLMKVPGVRVADIAKLAGSAPEARLLACGVFQAELGELAAAPNVSAELSSIESGDTLVNAIAIMGERRLVLGTHMPIYDPAPAVAKLTGDTVTLAAVGRENATDFFGAESSESHSVTSGRESTDR